MHISELTSCLEAKLSTHENTRMLHLNRESVWNQNYRYYGVCAITSKGLKCKKKILAHNLCSLTTHLCSRGLINHTAQPASLSLCRSTLEGTVS